MAKRHKRRARERRAELLQLLGAECKLCKTRPVKRPGELEFDVILPVDHGRHHSFDTSRRMTFYFRQYAAGNLQILCHYHNAQKGFKDRQWLQLTQSTEGAECPF